MPEHLSKQSILTLLASILLVAGGLLAGSFLSGQTPVALAQPIATPLALQARVVVTPEPPAKAPDYSFRALLAVPFAPVLPDLTFLAEMEEIETEIAETTSPRETSTAATEDGAARRVPLIDAPDGVINIVLLGTDRRPRQGDWRTDTIIIVSINTKAESVGMLSIPRDLWVKIPDFGVGRINTVDFIGEWKDAEGGGPGLLARTIEENLGIPIHRFVRIDLEGFIQVIDALGGVTIDIDCPVRDYFLDEPITGESGFAALELDPGVHHLDGLTALRYARSRRAGSDFSRARRQQHLLRSLAEQKLNWRIIPRLPELWRSLHTAVDTDLSLMELMQLAPVGLKITQDRIKNRFIDWRTTENWVTPGGAMVLIPNRETLPKAVEEFLNPPQDDVYVKVEHARIEIQNGTPAEGLTELAVKRLQRAGFEVVGMGKTALIRRSTVVVYNPKPRTLKMIQEVLELDPEAVVYSPEPNEFVDLRVILGKDWKSCG